MSQETQESTADSCVPGESERHAGQNSYFITKE